MLKKWARRSSQLVILPRLYIQRSLLILPAPSSCCRHVLPRTPSKAELRLLCEVAAVGRHIITMVLPRRDATKMESERQVGVPNGRPWTVQPPKQCPLTNPAFINWPRMSPSMFTVASSRMTHTIRCLFERRRLRVGGSSFSLAVHVSAPQIPMTVVLAQAMIP